MQCVNVYLIHLEGCHQVEAQVVYLKGHRMELCNSNFFIISLGGVRLSPLIMSATIWHIVPAPDDR